MTPPKPIKLTTASDTIERCLWDADMNEFLGNGSYYIDTRTELSTVLHCTYVSNDPHAQIDFYSYVLPQLERNGWSVPYLYKETFGKLTAINAVLKELIERGLSFVFAPIAVPYKLDLQRLVQDYNVGWSVENKYLGLVDELKDENGNTVLCFVRGEANKGYQYIYSPLSGSKLAHSLLWLPPYLLEDFTDLLGLPKKTVQGTKEYVRQRIEWEENNLNSAAPYLSANDSDDICNHVSDEDTIVHAETIYDAVMSQCSNAPSNVGFPQYSLTTPLSEEPTLHTKHQYTCIVFMLRDKKSGLSLMAHIPTSDGFQKDKYLTDSKLDLACYYFLSGKKSPCAQHTGIDDALGIGYNMKRFDISDRPCCTHDKFPFEWYASTFRNIHFKNSNESDMEITVLGAEQTPRVSMDDALLAFKRYFPAASIYKLRNAYRTESWLDSRDGKIYLAPMVTISIDD